MNQLSIRCIKASFVYLALGIGLGVIFAFDRGVGGILRPLHVELNLWGWATLLIYGMGYHMLPRFAGSPLRQPHLAAIQSWLAIIGVALASVGWLSRLVDLPMLRILLIGGGTLQVAAAMLFVLLIGDVLRRARSAS